MVMQSLWSMLTDAWLPGRPLAVRQAEQKAFQLKLAGDLGFELPPTLITNRPADLVDFYREHDGLIVSKQAATAFPATIGFGMVRFTELVTTRDIAHAQSISYCPMIFQAYVPKRVELRITVVGTRVFAAEIHSQANNRTRHDWRRYDLDRTPHLPHDLPHDVSAKCVRLVEELGLRYGAIDMIVTPDERYVFVEINPNGQYLWIEHQTGLPISEAICDLLLAEEASAGVAA
jgi:glutathione synthase/RimK-type ligase-like ATP-grasp enzyme